MGLRDYAHKPEKAKFVFNKFSHPVYPSMEAFAGEEPRHIACYFPFRRCRKRGLRSLQGKLHGVVFVVASTVTSRTPLMLSLSLSGLSTLILALECCSERCRVPRRLETLHHRSDLANLDLWLVVAQGLNNLSLFWSSLTHLLSLGLE